MQEVLDILVKIWDFIKDIIDSLVTFIMMLGDTLESAYYTFNFDFLPTPLFTCLVVLFTTAVVKVIISMGGSSV